MTMTEKDIDEAMLEVAARRGVCGVSRDELFKAVRGIGYDELEEQIQELERKGYITIDWLGTYDFVIRVTPEGMKLLT